MKVIYEFPIKEMLIRYGYIALEISDGRLELDKEPDDETRALIKTYGGQLVKEKPAKAERVIPKVAKSGGKA